MHINPYVPIFTFLLTCAIQLTAQQTPFLNHYTWDTRLFNPASQGDGNGGEIAIAYRNQFQELEPSIRPNTYLLHADISPYIGRRIGLGVQLMGDKAHLLSRFQFSGFFGYHLVENEKMRFSLGAMAGLLNQKFNFDGVKVSDVLDLFLFYDQVNATRFDGGPGMAFEYRFKGGSFLALDAAAPQLFSSDIRIESANGTSPSGVVYDMIPHLLANARFRFQRPGFALEPNATFRAISGVHPLQTGKFDLNLNAYFLKENRLMLGGGMRTGEAGIHAHIGVMPTSVVRIVASVEMHSTLGTTYEVGVTYALSKIVSAATPASDLITKTTNEIKGAVKDLDPAINNVRAQHSIIEGAIVAGNAMPTRKMKIAQSEKCTYLLSQTGQEILRLQELADALDAKRRDAESLAYDAERKGEPLKPEARNNLTATKALYDQIVEQLRNLGRVRQDLVQRCKELVPEVNVMTCLRDHDGPCLEELLNNRMDSLPVKPANLFAVQSDLKPGKSSITYHFADDADAYALTPSLKGLADHIASQVREMEAQGGHLASVNLVTELQEDKNTLAYTPDVQYRGEFDKSPLVYTLIDNETGTSEPKSFLTAPGAPVTLEALGVLKLAALRQYLAGSGLPAGRINLEVRYNHSGNIYREETKCILNINE